MQDVLEDRSTAATGYIVFCFQVNIDLNHLHLHAISNSMTNDLFPLQILIGVSLMVYVVQKARRELQLALLEADLAAVGDSTNCYLDSPSDSKMLLTNLIA